MSEKLTFEAALSLYYKQSFPYQLIYNWFKYEEGSKNCFRFREFSFTLPGEIYIRYQSFDNAIEFRAALLSKIPLKIDAGAIYNMIPRIARSYPNHFKPQQRELVFDIDISDYDDVRNCCKNSDICEKCWPFMKIGAKILKTVLTREFAFKQLLFVFSGRRGFHCWVADKEARELSQDARKAIADYFSVVTGGQSMVKRVTLYPNQGIHPMLQKALEVIDQDFEDLMIDKQDFLGNECLIQNVLDLCEDQPLKQLLISKCKFAVKSTRDCWDNIVAQSNRYKGKRGRNYFIQEVKLQHCFPRIDANVTRGFNHLLKLPFCAHPKTGNICVPIDIDDIDSFDIFKVPKITDLTKETFDMTMKALDPYLKIMKNFVDGLDNSPTAKRE